MVFRSRLALRIFTATALVVVLVLALALLLIKTFASRAADQSIDRALGATASAINDQLESRSHTLGQVARTLAQVPSYVSRIEKASLDGSRADLLDQADEFQSQAEADWAILTDADGVLQASTRERQASGDSLAGGALVGIALGGEPTAGAWIEPDNSVYQAVAVPVQTSGGPVRAVLVLGLAVDSVLARRLQRKGNLECLGRSSSCEFLFRGSSRSYSRRE